MTTIAIIGKAITIRKVVQKKSHERMYKINAKKAKRLRRATAFDIAKLVGR